MDSVGAVQLEPLWQPRGSDSPLLLHTCVSVGFCHDRLQVDPASDIEYPNNLSHLRLAIGGYLSESAVPFSV